MAVSKPIKEEIMAVKSIAANATNPTAQVLYTTESGLQVWVDADAAVQTATSITFSTHDSGDSWIVGKKGYTDRAGKKYAEGEAVQYTKPGTSFIGFNTFEKKEMSKLDLLRELLKSNPDAKISI